MIDLAILTMPAVTAGLGKPARGVESGGDSGSFAAALAVFLKTGAPTPDVMDTLPGLPARRQEVAVGGGAVPNEDPATADPVLAWLPVALPLPPSLPLPHPLPLPPTALVTPPKLPVMDVVGSPGASDLPIPIVADDLGTKVPVSRPLPEPAVQPTPVQDIIKTEVAPPSPPVALKFPIQDVIAPPKAPVSDVQDVIDPPKAPRRDIQDVPPPPRPVGTAPEPVAVAQPAGRVFAAAILAASGLRDRTPRDEARLDSGFALPAAFATDTVARTVVQPTGEAQRAPLDLRQDSGLQGMIDRIETLRDDANARDTRIRLIPDALGAVDVSVHKDGETVHVHFTAETAATRILLTDAQPRLAELAEARGVRIGQSSVDGGEGGSYRPPHHASPPTFAAGRTARDDLANSTNDDRIA